MLLTVDVGNTHTVLGLYQGADLEHMWRVATVKQHTADEIRARLSTLFAADNIDEDEINGAALASVVPRLTDAWVEANAAMFGVETVVCTADAAGDLFQTDYPNPHEIGADRVADAVALREMYGAPAIVVDFGTATNIEILDENGFFVGGIIAPGVETSAAALFSQASRLANIGLHAPAQFIGRSTEQAVQSGIVLGEAARVDGLIQGVFRQLGYTAPVIATGGLANTIAEHSAEITEVNHELTLEGLRLIYEAR